MRAKIKQLDDAVKAIDKDIAALQDELTAVTEKRDKARESVQHLRKQRDEGVSFTCTWLCFVGALSRMFLFVDLRVAYLLNLENCEQFTDYELLDQELMVLVTS